jgi:hypothetical protein
VVFFENRMDEADGWRKVVWFLGFVFSASGFFIGLPFCRWIGLPRRIRFWKAMMLHHGLYFKASYDAEYEETLRAQELLERL